MVLPAEFCLNGNLIKTSQRSEKSYGQVSHHYHDDDHDDDGDDDDDGGIDDDGDDDYITRTLPRRMEQRRKLPIARIGMIA